MKLKYHRVRQKFRSAKIPTAKIPLGEISDRRIFRSAKITFGKNFIWRKVLRRKFRRRKFLGENSGHDSRQLLPQSLGKSYDISKYTLSRIRMKFRGRSVEQKLLYFDHVNDYPRWTDLPRPYPTLPETTRPILTRPDKTRAWRFFYNAFLWELKKCELKVLHNTETSVIFFLNLRTKYVKRTRNCIVSRVDGFSVFFRKFLRINELPLKCFTMQSFHMIERWGSH